MTPEAFAWSLGRSVYPRARRAIAVAGALVLLLGALTAAKTKMRAHAAP